MKLPKEIKKGLEQCANTQTCENCQYRDDCMGLFSNKPLTKDALAYIQQLEAGIDHAEKVAREYAKSITENLDKLTAKLLQLESYNAAKQKRIEELESRLAQVERENKAMLHDMAKYTMCGACKRFADREQCPQHDECVYGEIGRFEWRGLCDENTKEDE